MDPEDIRKMLSDLNDEEQYLDTYGGGTERPALYKAIRALLQEKMPD